MTNIKNAAICNSVMIVSSEGSTADHLYRILSDHLTDPLQACTTIEDLNAIEIKFEMMDFSK